MLKAPPSAPYIDADRASFEGGYGLRPFAFGHRLVGHPLFKRERLLELAEEMTRIPNGVVFNAADVTIGQRWDATPEPARGVVETLRDIETANAWIVLKRVDHVPEYRDLLESCLDEMQEACGANLGDLVKYRNCIIFINSPNRVTNYHIDREWNCLLQIEGTKRVSVFDRSDREVLPEEEIERFWTVDNNAAVYKPEFQDRARVFEIGPGDAVHIPINAPHWVRNGAEVSVSMSANFHIHDALLGYVYRTNYWLRRAGLRPTPPGRSRLLDAVKGNGYDVARRVVNGLRGRKP